MQNRFFTAIYISTFFLLFLILAIFLREGFIISDQEMSLWSVLGPALNSTSGYGSYISNAPLSFLNILGPLTRLMGTPSFLSIHLLCLAMFTLVIYMTLEPIINSNKSVLPAIGILSLFLLHPKAIDILTLYPLDLLIMISLWSFTLGLTEANKDNLGRGVLLMAFSSAFLMLSGSTGIAYALALFSIVPLLLQAGLFRESVRGGFLVLTFPAIMSCIGVFYISWLYKKDFLSLAFLSPVSQSLNFELLQWTPFLVLCVPILKPKKELMRKILSLKIIITSFLAYLILIALGKDVSVEVIIGIATIGVGFEFTNKRLIKKSHFVLALLFIAISWLINGFSNKQVSIDSKTWHSLNTWIKSPSIGKNMILSPNHTLLTLGLSDRSKTLVASDREFKERLVLDHFIGIDRLIVELPSSTDKLNINNRYQERYFFSPPSGMKLVFQSKNYRVYDINPEISYIKPSSGALTNGLDDPLRPYYDALLAVIFLSFILIMRMFYKHSEKIHLAVPSEYL